MKIVIIGAGEVGFHIASRLALESKDVVVVDYSAEALQRLTDSVDVQTVIGSGSSPSILESAGIREAEIMLAVTDSDEVNLVACLVADTLAPATKKLARLRDADFEHYHESFRTNAPHIDTVMQPGHRSGSYHRAIDECPGRGGRGRLCRRAHQIRRYSPGSRLATGRCAADRSGKCSP